MRKNFVGNKNFSEIKFAYNDLESSEKINLWLEKLDQILSTEISYQHKELIVSLKKELKRYDSMNIQTIKRLGKALASITPESDFIEMFSSLNDYNYNSKSFKVEKMATSFYNSFESIHFENVSKISATEFRKREMNKPDCNCKWTCSFFENSFSKGDDCEKTRSGCGFLWMQSCTSHV